MANGVLSGAPPGLRGWLLADEVRARRQAEQMGALQGVLGLQGALSQQRFAEQAQPLQLETMQAQLQNLKNPTPIAKDLGDRYGIFHPRTFQPLGFIPKNATPGEQLRATTTRETSLLNPDVIAAREKIAGAGASRQITNVNTFTPASEAAQTEFMKSTRTTYDQLKHAPVLLENIDKAKALIPGARGFMGTGGETLLEAAKFLNNRIGTNINTEGIKNAEELRSRIFFNIMDNLKKMDAQPSQMQQQIMQDSLGKLGTDPNALSGVLDAYADTIRGKVVQHNREVGGATQRGVKFPYDPVIELRAGPVGQGKARRFNPATGKIE